MKEKFYESLLIEEGQEVIGNEDLLSAIKTEPVGAVARGFKLNKMDYVKFTVNKNPENEDDIFAINSVSLSRN